MNNIDVILREIESVYRLAENYAAGNVQISDTWSAVKLRSILSIDENRKTLDDYITQARQHLESVYTEKDYSNKYTLSSDFVHFEMTLSTRFRFKSRDLDRLVAIYQKTENTIESHNFVRNSGELVEKLELAIYKLRDTVDESRKEQRREKKIMKQDGLWRIWLTTFGTLLTLGDVVLALPSIGLAIPIAVTSIKIGATAVGAATFNKSTLMKSIPKLLKGK